MTQAEKQKIRQAIEHLQSPVALERLKELAEKATEGPWAYEFTGEKSNDWCVGQVCGPDGELKSGEFVEGDCVVELVAMAEDARLADARFIAATDPQTVLALIEMVEEREWKPIEEYDGKDEVLLYFPELNRDNSSHPPMIRFGRNDAPRKATHFQQVNPPKDGC